LQAFVDERLDGPRRDAVEAHLARHPELRERIAAERRQRASLRAQLQGKAAEPIPARLRIATLQAARRARLARRMSLIAAAVAIFVVGGSAGWFTSLRPTHPPLAQAPTTAIAQERRRPTHAFTWSIRHGGSRRGAGGAPAGGCPRLSAQAARSQAVRLSPDGRAPAAGAVARPRN
jgi:anti-sigma factor RsiW